MPDQDQKPGLRLTGPGALGAATVIGLVVGWAVRPLSTALGITAPEVSVLQMISLVAVAVLLFLAARSMRRHRHRPDRGLTPSQAVNRLAMAKASAIGGAFIAAAYTGHALSWVGVASEAAPGYILRALLGALAAVSVLVGGLVLERACRADFDDD
jgi:lysylphosphatidylglycerol synthetase-like protein (DUF2156 family)